MSTTQRPTPSGSPQSPPDAAALKRYRGYVADETDGIYIYQALAEIEEDEHLQDVYRRLAEVEERHRSLWEEQIRAAGEEPPTPDPSLRARTLIFLARRFGPDLVMPMLKRLEAGADEMYAAEPLAVEHGLPEDERQHSRVFTAIGSRPNGIGGSVIGRIESRHRSLGGGNALRASVLGANDGLVSNLGLVMGVAGAAPGHATVILAGLAGLLAGAASMALGEWISVTSSREAAEGQLAAEQEEIAMMPEAEREELALIYQAKGLPRHEAEALADRIIADPEQALGAMAREELGIVPEDIGSPWTAATASFILFAIGAAIPVLPFIFAEGNPAIVYSAIASGFGLFALGAGITLFTGRSVVFSGLRQVGLGAATAVVTFAIGSLFGVVVDV